MNLKKTAIVLNGFIHDFATGYWLSAMISIVYLHNFQSQYPAVADLLGHIERFFFWSSIGAMVLIFATGGARTFTYVNNFFGADVEKTRRKMLVIKHVLLVAIAAAGGYLAYVLTFH